MYALATATYDERTLHITGLSPSLDRGERGLYETLMDMLHAHFEKTTDPNLIEIMNGCKKLITRTLVKRVSMPRIYGSTYEGMKSAVFEIYDREALYAQLKTYQNLLSFLDEL